MSAHYFSTQGRLSVVEAEEEASIEGRWQWKGNRAGALSSRQDKISFFKGCPAGLLRNSRAALGSERVRAALGSDGVRGPPGWRSEDHPFFAGCRGSL